MVGESDIRATKNIQLIYKGSRKKKKICSMNTEHDIRLQKSPCVFFCEFCKSDDNFPLHHIIPEPPRS
jgi:hypothetical protein